MEHSMIIINIIKKVGVNQEERPYKEDESRGKGYYFLKPLYIFPCELFSKPRMKPFKDQKLKDETLQFPLLS